MGLIADSEGSGGDPGHLPLTVAGPAMAAVAALPQVGVDGTEDRSPAANGANPRPASEANGPSLAPSRGPFQQRVDQIFGLRLHHAKKLT